MRKTDNQSQLLAKFKNIFVFIKFHAAENTKK